MHEYCIFYGVIATCSPDEELELEQSRCWLKKLSREPDESLQSCMIWREIYEDDLR